MKKALRLQIRPVWVAAAVFPVIIAVALLVVLTRAAPLPPRQIVNHQLRQCAVITPGDECGDAILPPGWEYTDAECPAGYTTGSPQIEWAHFKVPWCCTESHSGVPGDCKDVIVQRDSRQCAFVDDLQKCLSLPPGWQALGRDCPVAYTWVDNVPCTVAAPGQVNAETAPPKIQFTATAEPPASQPTARPEPGSTAGSPGIGICSGPAALGLILAAGFFTGRRKSDGPGAMRSG